MFGQDRDYAELLDNTVITLNQEQLRHVNINFSVDKTNWNKSVEKDGREVKRY